MILTVLPESVNTTRSNSLSLRRSREFVWRLSNIANEMRKCEPQIRTFFEIARSYDDQAASSCLWNDLHPKLSIRTRPEPTVDRATLASLPRRSLTEGAIEECWSCGVAIQRLAKLKSKLRSDRTYFQPHPLSTSGRLPSHWTGKLEHGSPAKLLHRSQSAISLTLDSPRGSTTQDGF